MKNKKILLIARVSVQNFKVSEEFWKLYIVRRRKFLAFPVPWHDAKFFRYVRINLGISDDAYGQIITFDAFYI